MEKNTENTDYIGKKFIGWYKNNARELPWRETSSPYFIWLSEIILQQTRVQQGLPYYYRFIEHFPTVEALANASEQHVLKLWEGLGYYSRARNLHKCAIQIMEDYQGEFPNHYSELLKLKGVGTYTAAAIASFAFNEPVPVLDGNVFRVLSRLFGIYEDIAKPASRNTFFSTAQNIMPKDQPGTFNQSIMEFGALQCTPRNPNCTYCPFAGVCYAFEHNMQSALPVKTKVKKNKIRFFNYIVIEHKQQIMIQQRTKRDIWQGLYEFPLIEKEKLLSKNEVAQLVGIESDIKQSDAFKHILSHQIIHARFFHIRNPFSNFNCNAVFRNAKIVSLPEAVDLPKPILIVNYLNKYF